MPRPRSTAHAVIASMLAFALLTACTAHGPSARVVEVEGDITTHDPALVVTDDAWYVYSTGDLRTGYGAPQIRRSTDNGATWELVGTVWDETTRPRWVYDEIPTVSNFWAPEVVEHEGTYYLYYSASTFGRNASVIGLTTNTTLDPDDPEYEWTDQGMVWSSQPGESDYNAIDPGVVTDETGTPWMAFGSFWGGIQLLELEWPSGKPTDGAAPVTIASRGTAENAIEAPYLYHHDGWYYLFVSRDRCCSGVASTYNIAVGRSQQVTGPYLGPDGTPMTQDGGLALLGTIGDMIGPGGQSVSGGYLAFHYYDGSDDGAFKLAIRELEWDEAGWPVAMTADEADQAREAG